MKVQWVAQSLLNSSEKQTNHFQCATDSNNHNLVIGCSKAGVFILTLKWRKKPFLPRKKVCDSTNRPYTPGRWFISDNNGVSNSEFSPWVEPFLALLQQRKVFLFPATPENICQNTELVAVFSWNKCCFLLTALAVEINFGELRILEHSPPTQARVIIGNSPPLPKGHCEWTCLL